MPFKKGQVANPKGRGPQREDIAAQLAKATFLTNLTKLLPKVEAALEVGLDMDRTSVGMINIILDRIYGKPTQAMEVTGKDGKDLLPVLNITIGPREPNS